MVDDVVSVGSNPSQDPDVTDQSKEFTVKLTVAPPPPPYIAWLFILGPLAVGAISSRMIK